MSGSLGVGPLVLDHADAGLDALSHGIADMALIELLGALQ